MKKLPILLGLIGLAATNFTQKTLTTSLANVPIKKTGISISIPEIPQFTDKKIRNIVKKIGRVMIISGALIVIYDKITRPRELCIFSND